MLRCTGNSRDGSRAALAAKCDRGRSTPESRRPGRRPWIPSRAAHTGCFGGPVRSRHFALRHDSSISSIPERREPRNQFLSCRAHCRPAGAIVIGKRFFRRHGQCRDGQRPTLDFEPHCVHHRLELPSPLRIGGQHDINRLYIHIPPPDAVRVVHHIERQPVQIYTFPYRCWDLLTFIG